jgi:lipid-A-disaccharide synthase
MQKNAGQKSVVIIAGEASGDLHGSKLVEAMRRQDSSLKFYGIGGRALKEANVTILVEAAELAVVGITEVFSKSSSLLRGLWTAKRMLKRLRPKLLIVIDFPDFNLHVASTAKKLGIPVLYYISPQIWAWRQSRIRKIKKRVDHMVVILPFEETFYRKYDVPVTFVGHPLLDEKPLFETDGRKKERLPQGVIGLLPGSRTKEVTRHLPVMLAAALNLQRRMPGLRFAVSCAPTVDKSILDRNIQSYPQLSEIEVVCGHVSDVFQKSRLVVAVSGTVTLEAAISGTPAVIVYKVSPLSYWVGRMLIHVPYIGLVNLIADREIVPELIQKDASPQKIADIVLDMLQNPDKLENMTSELSRARAKLGEAGASHRAAEIALKLMYHSNNAH